MWFVVESEDGAMFTVRDEQIRLRTSLEEEGRSTEVITRKRAMKRAKAIFLDALRHEFQ